MLWQAKDNGFLYAIGTLNFSKGKPRIKSIYDNKTHDLNTAFTEFEHKKIQIIVKKFKESELNGETNK